MFPELCATLSPATGAVSYNAVLGACKDGLPEASTVLPFLEVACGFIGLLCCCDCYQQPGAPARLGSLAFSRK